MHFRRLRTTELLMACTVALAAAGCGSSPNGASAGGVVDDTVITSKVNASFVKDETVDALDIRVETSEGMVQLSGFASSEQEINRAVELARAVDGVKQVRNDIELAPGR